MSNDLLFSIIPRVGKVPVKSSSGVTRVSKDKRSDYIDEDQDQKDTRKETQRVDQEIAQSRHGKVVEKEKEAENESGQDEPKSDDGHLDTYV